MKHFISKFPFFGGNFQQLNNQKGIKDDVEKNRYVIYITEGAT